MTNPAAVIGLTYRGTDLQDADFGMFLEIVRGLDEPPAVRGTDVVIPGGPGQLAGSRVLDILAIELQGLVTGDATTTAALERQTFRTRARDFGALFDPTIVGTLEATLEDGTTQSVEARTLIHTWDLVSDMLARVNVSLESVSPDWS